MRLPSSRCLHVSSRFLRGIAGLVCVCVLVVACGSDEVEDTQESVAAQADGETEDAENAENVDSKEARWNSYQEFRVELRAVVGRDPFELETEMVPGTDFAELHSVGDVARVSTVVDFADTFQLEPMISVALVNNETGYVHVTTERAPYLAQLREFGRAHGPADVPEETRPVETVRVNGDSGLQRWSRGIAGDLGMQVYQELDSERWYANTAAVQLIRYDYLFGTMEDALDAFNTSDTPAPTMETEESGQRVLKIDLAASDYGSRQVIRVTAGSDGRPEILEQTFFLEEGERRQVTTIERLEEIEIPAIIDVLRSPTDHASFESDNYSWSGAGSVKDPDAGDASKPWVVHGRVHIPNHGDAALIMTAGDAAAFLDLEEISVPADAEVVRQGHRSAMYTSGLFPELVSDYYSTRQLNSESRYIYDPFGVPAHLFQHGLSEEEMWDSMRTVPEVLLDSDWDDHRVTRGVVDPEYWNWRQREGDGIFEWAATEKPGEGFIVTIGADADGRARRFLLETTHPDGGGMTFDVMLDETPKPPIDPRGRADSLSAALVTEDPMGDEMRTRFDEFFAANRAANPTFDHSRVPEHLTIVLRSVMDDPSGHYEPRQGEDFYRWSDVYFSREKHVGALSEAEEGGWDPTALAYIACIEREDNEWRYEENEFERLWHHYADGSPLDNRLFRTNANGWFKIEIYPSSGPLDENDPCAVLPDFWEQ